MKTPGFLAASMAATTVLTGIKSSHPDPLTSGRHPSGTSADKTSCSPPEKFAPRFDGLRFIETLVTAHR
ncbi:hypothetical protein HanXRQr2_Chr17g0809861 [Helianthus annuus]|uniref:Uncharacterized protein n=1 Tax=Helianthus annuus TaxID=4232 RepID=A0A251RR24_HELAN|nr:hypothetical protein HanXRQr2_Chr17g0809861 [Helianthus annuus]KAJ0813751.1 hypothetical protein HanPSC8_Chr17g0777271 [Helianthus annuus]